MALNEWGDETVGAPPVDNEWGDSPVSASPYAAVIETPRQQANRAFIASLGAQYGAGDGASPATLVPSASGYRPSTAAKLGLRVGVPLAVGVGTGGVGLVPAIIATGSAAAAGEAAAQGLEVAGGERQDISLPQVGASGVINSIPGLPLTRVVSPLVRGGIRVLEGAGLGAAFPAVEAGLRGELPQISDVGQGALYGGAFGLPFGGLELARGARAARPRVEQIAEPAPAAIPDELAAAQIIGRMEGKTPEQQLAVVKQEMALGKDILTPDQKRAGLEIQQTLEQNIEAAKLAEPVAEAPAPVAPEIPESTKILSQPVRPVSVANVATEVGTQTQNSPYALQTQVNKMTATPPAVAAAATPPVASMNASDFRNWAAQQQGGITTSAYAAGLDMIGNAAAIAELKASRKLAEAEFKAANDRVKAGDDSGFDDASAFATKAQYFREAIEAAEGKGSAMTDPRVAAAHQSQTQQSNAIQEPSPTQVGEQSIGSKGPREVGSEALEQGVQGSATPEAGAIARPRSAEQRLNNADIGLTPLSSMSRAAKLEELTQRGVTEYKGSPLADLNPAQISAALGQARRQAGFVAPRVASATGGAAVGGVTGFAATDREEGESEEAFQARRLRNAALGAGAGLAAGAAAPSVLKSNASRYKSPELKRVQQMLTPKEESASLLKLGSDAYNNLRYRFNTRYAPIGQAQRALFKAAGRDFVPGSHYDMERGFERVAGAPVQAEGEVELIHNLLQKLPSGRVQDLDTYLTLARIEDRLLKTGEENNVLMDAVGRAQAELDAARTAQSTNPTQRGYATVAARQEDLAKATKALEEGFNRKRVGDWSINDARKGLADLESEIGAQDFEAIKQAAQEYQNVMRRTLQIQVDSGRMSQQLMDTILASNDFYAPFKVLRHYEEAEGFVKGGGTARIPTSEALAKKITGIDDNDVRIGSPLSVSAEQVYKGYILAQKNIKMRQLATLARLDPEGEFVAPLGEGIEPRKGYEAVSYFVNGEPRRLEVSRPIAESLNGLNAAETDIVLNSLGKFAGVFKLGATGMSVPFNISNALVFDPIRLATISKYGFRGPQDFLYTLYEWPKALLSSARGNIGQYWGMAPDALYEQWIKSGAANSTLARVMNPEAFTKRLPGNLKPTDLVTDTNFGLGAPIKIAALMSNTLEETTKLLGLQRAMRIEGIDKLPPAQRQRKWDEIVNELRNYAGSPDFSRAGVNMRALNIVMPFLNPRWQGFLADFSRLNPMRHGNAKDAGAAWARLGALVAIPAASLAYYNLSTPENERDYMQIPQQDRERYFHIPLNLDPEGKPSLIDYGKGGYYFKNKDGAMIRGYQRIPKREFPGLMANTIEDFMGYAKANSPETFAQIGANFADNFANTASPVSIQGDSVEERISSAFSGVNPALRLPVEVAANRNFYTGRDIVPESRLAASPELQYTESTPEAYRTAAENMPDVAPEFIRSPAKLQHITEGMTGGFIRQFASPQLSPGNPAAESSPLLGRFYRSERVENEALMQGAKEAERGRADERISQQEIASKLADIIISKPTPEAKQKALADAQAAGLLTGDTLKYLKEDMQDAARGLTYEDRVVKRSYTVAGGYRARYFLDKLAGLTPEQRIQYLQEQQAKGLLTKEVAAQMRDAAGR